MSSLIYFIVALAILITVHEFGHFWVARRCGVKVLKFSIGFGKPIWQRRGKDGTDYVLALIPLGGYVKMLDEREGKVDESELDSAFNRKSLAARTAVVAAGPLANIIFAIAAYWLIFVIGVAGLRSIVGDVKMDSPAAYANLQVGDEIAAVNGHKTPTWTSVHNALMTIAHEGGTANIRVDTAGVETERSIEVPKLDLGVENPRPILTLLGISPIRIDLKPVIGRVVQDMPADKAGLKTGDILLEHDGRVITNWTDWVELIRASSGKSLPILLERDGNQLALTLTPIKSDDNFGQIGASVDASHTTFPEDLKTELRYGPLDAIGRAVATTWQFTSLTVKSIAGMLAGDISSKNIGGPISIAQFAGASGDRGFISFLGFLAVISISLGILNLLPIPVLDGGHLVLFFIEWVKGSPVSEQAQIQGQKIGFLLLMSLMFLAFFNDLSRLFG